MPGCTVAVMSDLTDPTSHDFLTALGEALDTGAVVPVTEADAPGLAAIGQALAEQGYDVNANHHSDVIITSPDGERSFTYRRQD